MSLVDADAGLGEAWEEEVGKVLGDGAVEGEELGGLEASFHVLLGFAEDGDVGFAGDGIGKGVAVAGCPDDDVDGVLFTIVLDAVGGQGLDAFACGVDEVDVGLVECDEVVVVICGTLAPAGVPGLEFLEMRDQYT